jgi:hypothetical protein
MGGILLLSTGCATAPPCPVPQTEPPSISQPLSATPSVSAALERKMKLQEKRIAELTMQLKMLKHIDLDRSKR